MRAAQRIVCSYARVRRRRRESARARTPVNINPTVPGSGATSTSKVTEPKLLSPVVPPGNSRPPTTVKTPGNRSGVQGPRYGEFAVTLKMSKGALVSQIGRAHV